ncbi:MAG: GntR family transcriptional regulator [Primorskyibacter sp.]
MSLLPASTLPLYVQIADLLVRDIAAGRLVDGDRLPPERALAADLGTTITTLRRALAVLAERGLIERIHGSGNYIRSHHTRAALYGMFRLELHNGGGLPIAHVLDVVTGDKPADLPPFGTHTQATRIRRQRFLDDTLVALEEIWLDASAGTLTQTDLTPSLYDTYKTRLGFWITRAEDRVGLGHIPTWAPPTHCQAAGAMSGYVERLSWATAPDPIEFSRTWFDPDRALYTQRLI